MIVRIPGDTMVVLVGPSGSGKSSFAARHFTTSQVLSSDALRALVADDPNDQTATDAAFELLHTALAMRLARRRLTVVDATSVEAWARGRLLAVARQLGRPAAAIVFNLPLAVSLERNAVRTDRRVPPAAIRRQFDRMRSGLGGLAGEGFDPVVLLSTVEEVDRLVLEAAPI